MKKFFKYLFFVVLAYVSVYATYNALLLFRVLDFYFVCLLSLVLVMSVWCLTGIIAPKKLPFFCITERRAIIMLIFVLFCYAVLIAALVIESYFFKRDPIIALKRNTSYLVGFFAGVDPFNGDSYSFQSKMTVVQENDPKQMNTNTDESLPQIHNVTISEVKQDFPDQKPKRRRSDGAVA